MGRAGGLPLPPVYLNSRALTAEIWWGWRRAQCKVSRRPEHSVRKGALQCGEHRARGQAEELQPHAPAPVPGHLGAAVRTADPQDLSIKKEQAFV